MTIRMMWGCRVDTGDCGTTPAARRFARLHELDKRKGHDQAMYMVIGYPRAFMKMLDAEGSKIYTEPLRCVTELHRGELPDRDPDAHIS